MTPGPAVAGSASATTPMTTANAVGAPQGGAPPQGDAIQQLADQIREVGGMVDEIAASNPALANEVAQVKQTLRSMIVKAAQAASVQTQSGMSLPTAGGM